MIRVLVADDNGVVRRGMVSIIEELDGRFKVVAEAEDGEAAVRLAQETQPDIALLDIRMPGLNGIEVTARLADSCKVLMVTYSDEVDLVVDAIRAGASGYLVHGRFDPRELGARMAEVLAGETVLSPSLASVVFEALRRPSGRHGTEDGPLALTGREREIVNLVAQGLTNAAIADELFLTERTIKNYLSSVYAKLGVHTRAEAIVAWLGTERRGA